MIIYYSRFSFLLVFPYRFIIWINNIEAYLECLYNACSSTSTRGSYQIWDWKNESKYPTTSFDPFGSKASGAKSQEWQTSIYMVQHFIGKLVMKQAITALLERLRPSCLWFSPSPSLLNAGNVITGNEGKEAALEEGKAWEGRTRASREGSWGR